VEVKLAEAEFELGVAADGAAVMRAVAAANAAVREQVRTRPAATEVGRCRSTLSIPPWKAPRIKRSKVQYDETLSRFAFKLNLRRYTKATLLAHFNMFLKVGPGPPDIARHVMQHISRRRSAPVCHVSMDVLQR
jgi:hypothetical protein